MKELRGSLAVDGFFPVQFRGCFWLSAADIIQSEYRTCDDDTGDQPFYDSDGSTDSDTCIFYSRRLEHSSIHFHRRCLADVQL